jgi:integrase
MAKSSKYGMGSIFQRGETYWICYYVNGERIQESARTKERKTAQDFLKRRQGEAVTGAMKGLGPERVTIADILQLHVADMEEMGKRTTAHVKAEIRLHLEPKLGKVRCVDLGTKQLKKYRDDRKLEKGKKGKPTSNATINREIAALKRSWNLGTEHDPPLILRPFPGLDALPENNVRQGFLEEDGYHAMLRELPDYLKAIFVCAYECGIRRGQLTLLKWQQVDFQRGVIVWYPEQTKNESSHDVPFIGKMRVFLEAEKLHRDAAFPKCDWVFAKDGERVITFNKAWRSACERAGVAGQLFHDMRRSAARRLEDAGVPRTTAMLITGHKTESMYLRYAGIRNSKDLQDAARKIEAYRVLSETSTKISTVSKKEIN